MSSVPSLPLACSGVRALPNSPELNFVGVLDHFFAFSQPHVRFLPVASKPFSASAAPELPMKICSANVVHLHFKNPLYCFLDFRVGGVRGDLEYHGVLRLLHTQTLLGDDRPLDDL